MISKNTNIFKIKFISILIIKFQLCFKVPRYVSSESILQMYSLISNILRITVIYILIYYKCSKEYLITNFECIIFISIYDC